jgi:hypothetical protein
MKIFVLWKMYPFQGSHPVGYFAEWSTAMAEKDKLVAALRPEEKPEYDEWGLVEGVDYQVLEEELK